MSFLSSLFERTKNINSNRFLQLIQHVNELHFKESFLTKRIEIKGDIICLQDSERIVVIGDLHGDLNSLSYILKREIGQIPSGLEGKHIVFLGDYGDRGPYPVEVYCLILELKLAFPNNIFLIRGNHEGPDDLLAQPYDVPYHLWLRFGKDWKVIEKSLKQLFRYFHTAVLIKKSCIMFHGGVPSKVRRLDDLVNACDKHPDKSHLEEILWSDPVDDVLGTKSSPRGAGRLFGEDVTEKFLDLLKVDFIIRSHEPSSSGYKMNHSGKIFTIFSRKGLPYRNLYGSYLSFKPSKNIKSAIDLLPFTHRF